MMADYKHGPAPAIFPEMLLVQASATLPLAALNAALRPHRLWLPIVPLAPSRTLTDFLRQNAGGRYQLKHGTIAHYVRAATLISADPPGTLLYVGGPTLKRSTGYGLARAIVGDGIDELPGIAGLHDVTLHVRPLPPERGCILLACPNPASACQLAQSLINARLDPAALAVHINTDATSMLVVLEGIAPVLERQATQVARLATQAACTSTVLYDVSAAWQPWEALPPSTTSIS
ncbi:MAG: FAD-binding protein [Chloroflexaceae bacterium]|nr:FAD-binding protein [Chloroflexaceae bacterium]